MDAWDEGTSYEDYMGRWSRLMAHEFLAWLDVPPNADWLDVGCGTGALTSVIVDSAEPRKVSAVDPSPGFIEAVRSELGDRPALKVGDAPSLPFADAESDATVSDVALDFFSDPDAAIGDLRRVTRHGGVVAAYVWDYAEGMQMIRTFWDVAVALDPSSAPLDEATRFPLCEPGRLGDLFSRAELGAVQVIGSEVRTVFDGFDDYWRPFLGGQGPGAELRHIAQPSRTGETPY